MNNFTYEIDFLYSLGLTIAIEGIVIMALLYFLDREKLNSKNLLLAGVLPSFATLPYLWFVLPIFIVGNYFLYLLIGEVLVALVEMFIIKGVLEITFKKALFYSIVANVFSYGLGAILHL